MILTHRVEPAHLGHRAALAVGTAVKPVEQFADRLGLTDAERVRIPGDFAYGGLSGLSNELRERLDEVRPASLGQASRIPGMTPAALGLLAAAIGQRVRAAS